MSANVECKLDDLPEYALRKAGRQDDLVAIITNMPQPDISSRHPPAKPLEMYIGVMKAEDTNIGIRRIDDAIKLSKVGDSYKICRVPKFTTTNAACQLTRKGIKYLKENLSKELQDYIHLI